MISGLEKDIAKAKRIVFHLLKYRARSRKEIQDRLKHRKFSQSTIDKVTDYFDRLDIINDHEFASNWLNSRLRKPFGMRRIFFELRQKGINDDIIEQIQEKVKDSYNEYEVVSNLAKRKMENLKSLDQNKARRRIYGFLARRGFSIDTINEVISEL